MAETREEDINNAEAVYSNKERALGMVLLLKESMGFITKYKREAKAKERFRSHLQMDLCLLYKIRNGKGGVGWKEERAVQQMIEDPQHV